LKQDPRYKEYMDKIQIVTKLIEHPEDYTLEQVSGRQNDIDIYEKEVNDSVLLSPGKEEIL
jgi:hypothetical protein